MFLSEGQRSRDAHARNLFGHMTDNALARFHTYVRTHESIVLGVESSVGILRAAKMKFVGAAVFLLVFSITQALVR